MHVLMLCALDVWALRNQGGAPSLYRTLQAYGERGHRVTFVGPEIGANAQLPHNGGLRTAEPAQPPALPGVTFRRFHLPSLQESRLPLPSPARAIDQKLRFALLFPYLAARKAAQAIRGDGVDVLYGYEVHGILAIERIKRGDSPRVARYQGTILHPYLGNRVSLLRRYEEVRAMKTKADLYIMTNDGTRGDDVLGRLNPTTKDKLKFWRNGLEMGHLNTVEPPERRQLRKDQDLPPEAFVLLTASRLARWKRVDRAIAAMPNIVRSVPNAMLVIVGDGEERQNLERQARELGVQDAVGFVGAVPQESVAGYMQSADVFLALADLSNVGNPLLEAMTCGMPIVTIDAGDTGDLIRDGETGRLLSSSEPSAVTRAIVQLSDDEGLRCLLGAGARRVAEEEFWTWDQRMNAELEAVEQLVRRRQPQESS